MNHPEITAPTLTYQGKVELVMDIPSAATAKQFHEALRSDTSIIDTRKEITWENKGGLYIVSFFLKPFVDGGRP